MRIQLIGVLTVFVALAACKREGGPKMPTVKTPQTKVPSGDAGMEFLFVCDKTTQSLSEDIKKSAIEIEGTSERRDLEGPGCDGRKILMPKFPRNNFRQELTIRPPANLKGEVKFAEIENTRTCASRRITFRASNQPTSFDSKAWLEEPYWIGKESTIVIGLTDWPARLFSPGLNILNGQNLMNVVYFGINGEELGRQTILVGVKIEYREINGIDTMESLCHLYIPPGEKTK